MVTVFVRYEIDPAGASAFEEYARRWVSIVPRCGGDLRGYFLPHEGTNYEAFGLIRFDTLCSYEAYRARLKSDEGAQAAFQFARDGGFIHRETRTFLREVTE